jgi:hypothetical protein
MHDKKNGIVHTRFTWKNLISYGKYIYLMMLVILFPCIVFATPSYKMSFSTMYNTTGGFDYQPVLGSCLTCHSSGSTQPNSYAMDYRNAGYDFKAIELLDSDGDGFDNITEINGGYFPGDPNSFPAVSPGDTSAPLITGFLVPDAFYSLTVPVQSFSAQDDTGVTGYLLTESPEVPLLTNSGWQPVAPTTFTFLSPGINSVYAWARDAEGNISQALMKTVNIEVYSPVADAGLDLTVLPGDSVMLDGSNSAPQLFGISSYSWAQDSGLPVLLSDPTSLQPTFQAPALASGESAALMFTLTVTDIFGNVFTDKCAVNVTAANQAPVADAGGMYNCGAGDLIVLDGSGSTVNNGGIVTYSWTQTGGTGVTLIDPNTVKPSFIAPEVGPGGEVLTFELVVMDSGGLQSTDTCTVEVAPLMAMPWDGIPGVVSLNTSTGKRVGIGVDSNTGIGSLTDFNPADIPDSQQKPMDMTYGLIDILLDVNPGATATLTVYLPNPAPEGYHWYKYYNDSGQWEDYCHTNINGAMGASFNEARDQVTLTLTDGGIGDDDRTVDGVISDPSGLGVIAATETPVDPGPSKDSSGGSGGCFISSVSTPDIETGIAGVVLIPAILCVLLTITVLILPTRKGKKNQV